MPKKAGKKGGGKLAGLTEEERLLYMQQKAQAEEEVAKRKEDMLTHFLKVCDNQCVWVADKPHPTDEEK